jgi:hypothetical protein
MLFRTSDVADVYRELADLRDRIPANVLAAACLVLLSELLEQLPERALDPTVFALEFLLEPKNLVGREALVAFCRAAALPVVDVIHTERRIQ